MRAGSLDQSLSELSIDLIGCRRSLRSVTIADVLVARQASRPQSAQQAKS
jgi:hypothetical protein